MVELDDLATPIKHDAQKVFYTLKPGQMGLKVITLLISCLLATSAREYLDEIHHKHGHHQQGFFLNILSVSISLESKSQDQAQVSNSASESLSKVHAF